MTDQPSATAPALLYLLRPCSRRQLLLRCLKRLLLVLYYTPSMALCNLCIPPTAWFTREAEGAWNINIKH
jgi:hypothetical protein